MSRTWYFVNVCILLFARLPQVDVEAGRIESCQHMESRLGPRKKMMKTFIIMVFDSFRLSVPSKGLSVPALKFLYSVCSWIIFFSPKFKCPQRLSVPFTERSLSLVPLNVSPYYWPSDPLIIYVPFKLTRFSTKVNRKFYWNLNQFLYLL